MARHSIAVGLGTLALGVACFIGFTEHAAAAPSRVTANTNLRQGPGIGFGVIVTVPQGSLVEVTECTAQWCTAHWRGRTGYMTAGNLDFGDPPPAGPPPVTSAPPAVVYESPPPYFGPPYHFYGSRYRYWGPPYRRYWRYW